MSVELSHVHTGVHSQAMRYISNMMTLKVLVKNIIAMVLIMLFVLLSFDMVLPITT